MSRVCASLCAYVVSCCVFMGSMYRLKTRADEAYLLLANVTELVDKKCFMGTHHESAGSLNSCIYDDGSPGRNKRHMYFGWHSRVGGGVCFTSPTCDEVKAYPENAQAVYDDEAPLTYYAACRDGVNKRKLVNCEGVEGHISPDSCEDHNKVWNGLNWRCEDVGEKVWSDMKPTGTICVFRHEMSDIGGELGCQKMAIRMGRPYYYYDGKCWTAWPCPNGEESPHTRPGGEHKFRYRPTDVTAQEHILITRYARQGHCLGLRKGELKGRFCEDFDVNDVEFLLPNTAENDETTRVVGKVQLADLTRGCLDIKGTYDGAPLILTGCDKAPSFSMPSIGYSGFIHLAENKTTCINLYWAQVFDCISNNAADDFSGYWATILGQ
eukprot:TRINITY_DN15718_c0_g3_i1.p1 TRINITY_DN15718_c0_g3~~TRINITY_DN15718_c0_g3_i1.p1  ORF type:complete len:391 (+),score=12.61 TRINITY_DN15718_c0_g3_i1:33-1175(+)